MKTDTSPDSKYMAEITLSESEAEHFWGSPGNIISIDLGGIVVDLQVPQAFTRTPFELNRLHLIIRNDTATVGQPFIIADETYPIT